MHHHRTELIDHIGLSLLGAAAAWQSRFTRDMIDKGHAWFADARSALIAHIDRTGTPQRLLAGRTGLSKQAVNQFIDELERDGIVVRRPDPADARGRIIAFTEEGLRALADANVVKRAIERDYTKRLGGEKFRLLRQCLDELAETDTTARR